MTAIFLKISDIVFQTLHAAFHVLEHRTGVLRLGRKKAHVVLVCLEFTAALLVDTHQAFALTIETVFVIADFIDRILERSHARTALRNVKFLIQLVDNRTVSLIDIVFLAERHMTDALPFGLKVLDCLDCVFASESLKVESLELVDNLVFLFEICTLGAACAQLFFFFCSKK